MTLVEVKPAIDIKDLDLDPIFEGGSPHIASALMSNPTAKEFTYVTELYLGITRAATSGVGSVTIPAGGSATVAFPIIAPAVEGTYGVWLDVHVGLDLIKHYKATEDVVVEVSPAIDIDFIGWE